MAPISVFFAINFLIRKNWIKKFCYLLAQLKILVKLEFDSNGVFLSWFLFLSDKNTRQKNRFNKRYFLSKKAFKPPYRGDMFYFNQLAAKFQEKLKTACQKMPNLHLSGSIYHCFNRLNFRLFLFKLALINCLRIY